MTTYYFVIFFASIICSSLLIIPMRNYAIKKQILDHPDGTRKTQKTAVPYLGGVALLITVSIIYLLAELYMYKEKLIPQTNLTILVPVLLLGLVGHIDDIYTLSVKLRLSLQILIAFVVSSSFGSQNSFVQISNNQFINLSLSTFWIILIINAINFIDNTDAVAAGSVTIICTGMLLISLIENQIVISSAISIVIGSCLGFLFWNWPPARIYLGDSGTLFLGALIALISIKLDPVEKSRVDSFLVILTIFAFPVLDFFLVIISRILKRESPFKSGRDHLSHRLIYLGFSKLKAMYLAFVINFYFVSSGIVIYFLNGLGIIWLNVINSLIFLTLLIKFLSIKVI